MNDSWWWRIHRHLRYGTKSLILGQGWNTVVRNTCSVLRLMLRLSPQGAWPTLVQMRLTASLECKKKTLDEIGKKGGSWFSLCGYHPYKGGSPQRLSRANPSFPQWRRRRDADFWWTKSRVRPLRQSFFKKKVKEGIETNTRQIELQTFENRIPNF